MGARVFALQGYAIVLDKVIFITRVFEAQDDEGFQFNVRMSGDSRVSPKYPTRHEADLARQLLISAISDL